MQLHTAIKKVRASALLKQGEMSKMLEISQSHLSLMESGKSGITVEMLKKISAVCKVPAFYTMLLATEESDIAPDKREMFRNLKPSLVGMMTGFLFD